MQDLLEWHKGVNPTSISQHNHKRKSSRETETPY